MKKPYEGSLKQFLADELSATSEQLNPIFKFPLAPGIYHEFFGVKGIERNIPECHIVSLVERFFDEKGFEKARSIFEPDPFTNIYANEETELYVSLTVSVGELCVTVLRDYEL